MTIRFIHRKLLTNLRNDAKRNRLSGLHVASGIPYSTLYDILKDKTGTRGNLKTWLRIDAYYSGLSQ
jgi:predicted transcriptional regulator